MNQTPLHAAAAGGSYSVVKLLLDAGVNIDTMDTNEVSYPGFIWGGGGGAIQRGACQNRISSPLGNCEHCMKCDIRLVMPPPPPPQAFLTIKFRPRLTSFLNEPLSYPEN